MYAPSNIFTMKINSLKIIKIIICSVLMLSLHCADLYAQENEGYDIHPLGITQKHPLLFDIYIYGSGSYKSHRNLWIASNNVYGSKHIYDTFADLGIEAEAYNYSWLRLGASLGYKYERYAYNGGFSSSEGILSHWLSTELNASVQGSGLILKFGAISDLYLSSRKKNNDSFSYEGINGDCFNNASFALFFGMGFNLNRIKFEGRIGNYFLPQLNPNKIAYYNLNKSYVSGLFWEVKVSYRIFTSGKHYNDSNLIE